MAAQSWKFSLGEAGTHLLRVANIGTPGQKIWLDGSLLDAPAGTLTFTGPAASLLELRAAEAGSWDLLVEGMPVESCSPDAGSSAAWWKFTLQGMGNHHLRVTNMGAPGQEVFLDGTPVDAPEGTTAFTGPGGSLLELQDLDGRWVLVADGTVFQQHMPGAADSVEVCGAGAAAGAAGAAAGAWTVLAPHTGAPHQLRVANLGCSGQEVFIDGVPVPAPEGTTTFTGPGGTLLELRLGGGGAWSLFVDGAGVEEYNARCSALAAASPDGGHHRAAVVPGGSLPQGVSQDTETGTYKANIKVKGRFKFLGDFPTPEEAHARYLAAKQELEAA